MKSEQDKYIKRLELELRLAKLQKEMELIRLEYEKLENDKGE